MKKYKASAYIIFAIVVIAAVAVIVSQITLQSQKEKSEAAETSSVSTQAVSSAKQTDTEDKNFSADESEPDTEMLETVDLMETADMIVYTYDELKEQADVIVKVKIKDDLTKENSVYRLAEPNVYSRDTGWCYSLREAEVIEVYRGGEDWHAGDTIKIQDACAIVPDGEKWFLYTFDEYEPPKKDTEYLLFLENGTKSGEPAIINYGNGSVNLDEPEENPYPDIAKAATEEFTK